MSNDVELEHEITKARALLRDVRFASMATVNEDGTPHNTPYFFMYDHDLTHVYWGSHPDSLHSQNVLRTGAVFIVLYDSVNYDSSGNRGGLYITAIGGRIVGGKELDAALAIHNATRARLGKAPLPKQVYMDGPQAMWCADINKLEVYYQERDANQVIVWEPRKQITADQLLS